MPRCETMARRLVPIPARALDGLTEFERTGLSRRDLLAGGVGLLVAANGLRGLLDARRARGRRRSGRGCAGCADPGLALPGRRQRRPQHARPRSGLPLAQLRSRIGVDPASALPLGDAPGFLWHHSLAGLRELYDAGKVAVLRRRASRPVALQLGRLLAQRHRRARARPQRLARTDARRRRHARQSAAGHSRRLGAGSVPSTATVLPSRASSSPSDFGFGIPDVWEENAFLPHVSPAFPGARQAPGSGRCAIDVRQHDEPTIAWRRWPRRTTAASPVAYPDSDLGNALGNLGACSARASAPASQRSRAAASTPTTHRRRARGPAAGPGRFPGRLQAHLERAGSLTGY